MFIVLQLMKLWIVSTYCTCYRGLLYSTLQSYTGKFLQNLEWGYCQTATRSYASHNKIKMVLHRCLMVYWSLMKWKSSFSWLWNSRSHHFVSLAMSPHDKASLQDIFHQFDPTLRVKQTNYSFCGGTHIQFWYSESLFYQQKSLDSLCSWNDDIPNML